MLSENAPKRFKDIVRCEFVSDLFADNEIDKPIEIEVDNFKAFFSLTGSNMFSFQLKDLRNPSNWIWEYSINLHGDLMSDSGNSRLLSILFYKFQNLLKYNTNQIDKLAPPFGENTPALLSSNSKLKKIISDFVRENGYRLTLKPAENGIMLTKEVGDELYSYSFQLVSETIRRIIFLMLAIESNKNSTLLFDEPEAHTFPFYTHYIAERIALDTSNQYFLTTHNSYLLHSIVEKTPIDELNVGIVYMENYETKVRILTPEQLSELSETDIFYNLELFLEA